MEATKNIIPLVLRVEDLTKVLDIGLNNAYDLVRSGQIPSIRIGRQYRIPREAVTNYLADAIKGNSCGDAH